MTSCLLCGVIELLVVAQHLERKDLYDRCMGRSRGEAGRTADETESGEARQMSAHRRAIRKWREGK